MTLCDGNMIALVYSLLVKAFKIKRWSMSRLGSFTLLFIVIPLQLTLTILNMSIYSVMIWLCFYGICTILVLCVLIYLCNNSLMNFLCSQKLRWEGKNLLSLIPKAMYLTNPFGSNGTSTFYKWIIVRIVIRFI